MGPGPSRASRSPPVGPPDPRQAHLRDDEIAVIFTDMRRACQLSREQLAVRLETPVRTVEALESGMLLALPEWPETSRVVVAYTGLLGLEPGPILRRIQSQLAEGGTAGEEEAEPAGEAEQAPEAPVVQQQDELVADRRETPRPEAAGRKRRRRRVRVLPWALLLVILAATFAAVVFAMQRPALVLSVTDQMPDPVPRLARAGLELLQPADDGGGAGPGPDVTRDLKGDKLPQAGENGR